MSARISLALLALLALAALLLALAPAVGLLFFYLLGVILQ